MHTLVKLALSAAVAALAVLSADGQTPGGPRHIDVTGEAEVRVVPDQAVVTLGVESWAPTLLAARTDNSGRLAKLLAVASKYGAAAKDISTDYASIEPQYDNGTDGHIQAISGYRVTNLVTIRFSDLTMVGPFVTEALTAGANRLDGVVFGLGEPGALRAQARVLAVKDAREKAVALASALGQNLGKPLVVTETSSIPYPAPRFKAMAMDSGPEAGTGEQFSPGQVTVTSQVSVEFELLDR